MILFPLFSFLCGLVLASVKTQHQLKTILSVLLAKLLIPFVIVYNMVFYQEGHLALIGLSILSAVLLYVVYVQLFKDRLQALCCSYTNIGWLGLPVAMAIFGSEVSAVMIALYIGGSLFGNIWATSAVSQTAQAPLTMIKGLLRSPPVIALCLAAVLRLCGVDQMADHYWIDQVYLLIKWGMSFTGMCVLGMWLRHTQVSQADLLLSTKMAAYKLLCGVVFCFLLYQFIDHPAIHQALAVIFLLFCLPPAANIVALETYYQGTGRSATYIAAGTIVSCAIIVLYAGLWHWLIV